MVTFSDRIRVEPITFTVREKASLLAILDDIIRQAPTETHGQTWYQNALAIREKVKNAVELVFKVRELSDESLRDLRDLIQDEFVRRYTKEPEEAIIREVPMPSFNDLDETDAIQQPRPPDPSRG